MNNPDKPFWADFIKAVLIIGLGFVICVLASCKSSKNVFKQTETSDSTSITELRHRVRTLARENMELQQRIDEMDLLGVQFDNDCDSVIRAALKRSGCNTDSINAVIASLKSSVKINSDGSMEVHGLIKSLTREKKRNEEKISSMQKTIDSLSELQKKETHWVRTVTVTKTIVKKKSVLNQWWLWVVFLVGGFVIGFRVCWKYKERIIATYDEFRN